MIKTSILSICFLLAFGSCQGLNHLAGEKREIRYGDYKVPYRIGFNFQDVVKNSTNLAIRPISGPLNRIIIAAKYKISLKGEMIFVSLDFHDYGGKYALSLPMRNWESRFSCAKLKLPRAEFQFLKRRFPNREIFGIDSWMFFY